MTAPTTTYDESPPAEPVRLAPVAGLMVVFLALPIALLAPAVIPVAGVLVALATVLALALASQVVHALAAARGTTGPAADRRVWVTATGAVARPTVLLVVALCSAHPLLLNRPDIAVTATCTAGAALLLDAFVRARRTLPPIPAMIAPDGIDHPEENRS